MSNFKADIERAARAEPIEGIVISAERGWGHEPNPVPADKADIVLRWAEAAPLLDYEYDPGYGGEDCHAIYAWTPSRVLFVGTYDGSTWVASVPRNPAAGRPDSVGGG